MFLAHLLSPSISPTAFAKILFLIIVLILECTFLAHIATNHIRDLCDFRLYLHPPVHDLGILI